MSKKYIGTLSLEWYNKQKSILLQDAESKKDTDIPAPKINWVNKDEALFYEINEIEGKGVEPYWVDRNDIRVKESRPLILQKVYKAKEKDKVGSIPGTDKEYVVKESNEDDAVVDNILIKGDNLLALNTLKKIFDNKPDDEKIKCVYIDPPFNTGAAFDHYDDNLTHSEWLTLMRDRIVIINTLMRNNGILFLHLDDGEVHYAKLLLDEIFGSSNFVCSVAVRSSTPSGVKTSHKDKTIIKQKDLILVYRKSDTAKFNPQYIRKTKWDTHFNYFVNKKSKTVKPLIDVLIENKILTKKQSINEFDIDNPIHKSFYLKNGENICQTQSHKNKDLTEKSRKLKDKILIINEGMKNETMFYNGRQLSPLANSLNYLYHNKKLIKDFGLLICDFWADIDFQNTQNEGDVSFPASKKPEELLLRIFNLATNEGELILDCFGGSGTSYSVAHKMKRKWIGIEVGKHSDSHIIVRMKNVLKGTDKTGISPETQWEGGGSFKYYHLGPSIIENKKDGTIDFNWSLGKKFIEESFLSSYDYSLIQDIDFLDIKLFKEKDYTPSFGRQVIGSKSRIAVVTLNEPKGKLGMITYEEVTNLYKKLKEKFSPEYINIFTNRGIDIASDSKPDDLEVIKIPNAIFSELEK